MSRRPAGPRPPRGAAGWGVVRRRRERGSATVLAVGTVGGLAVVLLAALAVVTVLVTGQQVRTAADLAALAGAGQVVLGLGQEQACAQAEAAADRNGGRLRTCELRAQDGQPWPQVLVSVERRVTATPWTLTARGAAGGTSPGPSPPGTVDSGDER